MEVRGSSVVTVLALVLGQGSLGLAGVDQEFMPPESRSGANVGSGDQIDAAQTFTVGVTGILTGFDIWVEKPLDATMPLLYDVRRTVNGVPPEDDAGTNILVSGSLDPSLIPLHREPTSPPSSPEILLIELWDDGLFEGDEGIYLPVDPIVLIPPPTSPIHVELSGYQPTVAAGEVLALVLRSFEPAGLGGLSYVWRGERPGGYARGEQFERSTGSLPMTWFHFGTLFDQNGDLAFRTYVSPIPEPSAFSLVGVGVAGMLLQRGVGRSVAPRRRTRKF